MNQAEKWAARGREIAAEQAVDLLLPSGVVVKARRPGPALLASWGRLPLSLAGRVAQVAGADAGADAVSDSQVSETMGFLRSVLEYCVVSPRIRVNPGAGEIHPAAVPDVDVDFLAVWAVRGDEAKSLETFRQYYAVRGAGGDGADVRAAAVGVAGNSGSGSRTGGGSGGGGVVGGPATGGGVGGK